MQWVVFLRGINVGGANLCKPAQLAKQLAEFDMVNIGAVGTFVIGKAVGEATLRKKIAANLAKSFQVNCEIMIVPAKSVLELARRDPFAGQPADSDITRFVSVLAKDFSQPPDLPLCLPSAKDWLLKITSIHGRFVVGMYRRQMKAISYLGKIEKLFNMPTTTRSWNTFEKVVKVLGQG